MKIRTDSFCQFQLPLCQIFDQVMHLIRICNVINQRIADLAQMMSLLKYSRCNESCLKCLLSINCIILSFHHIPLILGKFQRRCMYIIFPVFNIFYYDLIRSMYRERTWNPFRESIGYAPCIYHIFLSRLEQRVCIHKRMKKKLHCFILIDKSVRITALYNFQHILFWC